MRPEVPPELLDFADEWDDLHRWERSELGKALRRLGLTYSEIRALIPIPKGTLSYWCREIQLSSEQITANRDRSSLGSRLGEPVQRSALSHRTTQPLGAHPSLSRSHREARYSRCIVLGVLTDRAFR